jgi:hypothetical protein
MSETSYRETKNSPVMPTSISVKSKATGLATELKLLKSFQVSHDFIIAGVCRDLFRAILERDWAAGIARCGIRMKEK